MDRRPRNIPPEDRYGGGQSYRPGNTRIRTPPPPRRIRDIEGFNGRSPPRRDLDGTRPPFRPRSRSPMNRDGFRRRSPSPRDRFGVPRGGDSYRARPLSPRGLDNEMPRRDEDRIQRRDLRDEPRFGRRFGDDRTPRDNRPPVGRSPPRNLRDRSPPPLRDDRDRSPVSARGRRSPMPRRFSPAQRRFDDFPPSRPRSPPRRGFSPRGSDREFPSRPRSPFSRNDIANLADRTAESWRRPRSPSSGDIRQDRDVDRGSDSKATSRKSSPPLHATRLALVQDQDGPRSGRPSPRSNYGEVQARPVAQSPPRRFAPPPPKDGDGDVVMQDSRDDRRTNTLNRPPAEDDTDRRLPPSGPRETRAPPTGPRGPTAQATVPPVGPRGDAAPSRGGFVIRGRGSYTADFTGRGRGGPPVAYQTERSAAPSFGRGSSYERDPGYQASSTVPSGPRNFSGPPPRPSVSRAPSTLSQIERYDSIESPREPRNAPIANSTYRRPTEPGIIPSGPASDRSRELRRVDSGVHPALRDLPEVITNGRKLPPPVDHTRLNKFEDESEKLRKAIQEKEVKKRRSLREWDRLVREGESAAYRSEVAEGSVRAYELEAESIRPAF